MIDQQILHIAVGQSAIDLGCTPAMLLDGENHIVHSVADSRARRYLQLPFSCNLVSYGSCIVASVDPALEDVVADYLRRFAVAHCFETPNLHVLNDALQPYGQRLCFMAEYFLPDLRALQALAPACSYTIKLLSPADFAGLYLPQWSNALCDKRPQLDRLAVGAYDGETLVGLAGASADCDSMWQIGIDVLPAWRRKGIAAALTGRLALEILARGKVPFYCAAWSNLPSVRNALRCGFLPAWVELTAKPRAFVEEMNA